MAEGIYEIHEAAGGTYEAIGEYKGDLIRCKECRFFKKLKTRKSFLVEEPKCYCAHPNDEQNFITRTKGPEWYCADGERIEKC